jgi:type I restriction enzyme S subunit
MEGQELSLDRSSEYKDEVPWPEASLEEICAVSSGITKGRKPPSEPLNEVPYMAVVNVQDGRLNLDLVKTIYASSSEFERYQLLPGDLLLTEGGDPDKLGRGTIWNDEINPCIHQNHIFRVRANSSLINMSYLSRLVASPVGKAYFLAKAKQTTGIASINLTQLRSFPVPLPPLNEQHRIAAKLDTTLATVEACRQRLDGVAVTLKRFRQAVLAAATSGELTREWREVSGVTQDSWSTIKTKEVGKIQLGRQRSPKYHHGPTMRPYLRVQNVFEDRIDLDDVMEMDFSGADLEKYTLHPGDILLNEGQSPQYLGRPAMYRGELPGACFTNSLIRFQASNSVLSEFALLVFRDSMHSGLYVEKGTISTNIAHLSAGRFGEVDFPLPPLAEQQEIVRRAQELFTLADQLEARLTTARKVVDRLTPALLAKAFRGELVPQDPNDEPASVLLERIRAARQAEAAAAKPSRRGRPKAAATPDPIALEAAPAPADFLTVLLRECGALSERALLAASELEPQQFQRQLQKELESGSAREVQGDGQVVLEAVG